MFKIYITQESSHPYNTYYNKNYYFQKKIKLYLPQVIERQQSHFKLTGSLKFEINDEIYLQT